MFYEILGHLLAHAGGGLPEVAAAAGDDEFAQKQVRRVALLMQRVGGAWPAAFGGVLRESEILRRALAEARESLIENDCPVPAELEGDRIDDPLAEYRRLMNALDTAVIALHAQPGEWPRAALASVRRALAEAAEVQRQVLAGSMGDARIPSEPRGAA